MGDALPQMARERFELGPHVVELIDKNVFCIRWGRSLTYENMKQVGDFLELRYITSEPTFMLLDMRIAGMPDQRTRKYAVERVKKLSLRASAILGANLAVRTTFFLMSNVMRLLESRPPQTDFFEREDEALTWLLQQRDAFKAANQQAG